ncbi:MAG: hypothetical protein LBK63_09505 [Treponema sp.]|jgi:hypothetical protein|nr:hypothetical protein [Treponema sp.]
MNYNDTYNRKYDKIMDTIAFKNKRVTTIYMGSSTPAAEEGLTLAEFITDWDKGIKAYFHYVGRINERGPIDGHNTGYFAGANVLLALAWWSYIKMPGRELPENSIWQVNEKENMKAEDYDFILNNGMDAMVQQLMPTLFPPEDFQKLMGSLQNAEQQAQAIIDIGYPLLAHGNIVPPFETLCGGRGMNNFFMDCYKIPDKIKAVQDVMMESIRKQVDQIPAEKYAIGTWIGGWRGASNLVNQKIWDKLVWPYIY